MNEQTIRDNVKDSVYQLLNDYKTNDKNIGEMQADIADAVFSALDINEHQQDYFQAESKVMVFNSEIVCSSSWHIDDVLQQSKTMGVEITVKQAKDVLSLLCNKHDATIGTNWDVISCWIDHVLTEDNAKLKAEIV